MSEKGITIPVSESRRTGVRGRLKWLSEVLGRYATFKSAVHLSGIIAGDAIALSIMDNPKDAIVVGTITGFVVGSIMGEAAEGLKRRLLTH